ncbi:MAG: alginate O-acetyltransferase complex protein AlgI [Parvicella sp.]|jgi:alginate O-acetyltransferase complex protein AlgI
MLFNSIDFAIFLPIVFVIYWSLVRNLKAQNIILLIASYVFYGWWDWKFLGLIFLSSVVDFFIGLLLQNEEKRVARKAYLAASLFVNLSLLGYFKYFNFFLDAFEQSFTIIGYQLDAARLDIVLPVGISFYTFQTLSYTIDIYRKKLSATSDFIAFSSYVSFFPQLVAGPIERATNLLPQFFHRREMNYAQSVDGLRQILWGLFKKVVIADGCAEYANMIFNNYSEYSGSTLILGAVFFSFQIYCDFSGYSDIAIGTARLFGFSLQKNFAFPYFSRDIAEFWRRWHISLSTWFRDYLYIPLGGSRGSSLAKIRNTFIIFIVSGFWHGANWTFIVWGFVNALFFLPLLVGGKNRTHLGTVAEGKILPSLLELFQMGITYFLTVSAWVFFRSESIGDAFLYFDGIMNWSLLSKPQIIPLTLLITITIFILVEWFGRTRQYAIEVMFNGVPSPVRWLVYYLLVVLILNNIGNEQEFIYFQF